MKSCIKKVTEGFDLTCKEAEKAMNMIFKEATDAQIAAFLIALRMKSVTDDELTGFAKGMRKASNRIHPKTTGTIIDTCGTGGDLHNTINVSTISAIIASAAGVPVAKHGNYSVTSLSGSADMLKSLGIRIDCSPKEVEDSIEKIGIGFMLAPLFHPSMKRVAGIRRELGVHTIFNILGPLTNPAGAEGQVIGVYDKSLCEPMARVLRNLGVKRGLVVHGDRMDEISNISETFVAEINNDFIKTYILKPEELGVKRSTAPEIVGGTADENAQDALYILNGEKGPKRDLIVINAAASLYVAGIVPSIKDGVMLAENIIDSGKALKKLADFKKYSNSKDDSNDSTSSKDMRLKVGCRY